MDGERKLVNAHPLCTNLLGKEYSIEKANQPGNKPRQGKKQGSCNQWVVPQGFYVHIASRVLYKIISMYEGGIRKMHMEAKNGRFARAIRKKELDSRGKSWYYSFVINPY